MNDFEWTKDSNLEEGEAWKSIVRNSSYSPAKYRLYIETVNSVIKDTYDKMKRLERWEEISKMSYEEWLVFQNGIKDKNE